MSIPYFRLYPTDFEADTSHLTLAEDGAYNRLLRLCWMTPGCSLPNDEAWILRRMRVRSDEEKEVVRTVLAEFFSVEKQRVSNRRLMREFDHSTNKHEQASKNGAKGGRPAKALKTNETPKAEGSIPVKLKKANQNQNQNQKNTPLPPEGFDEFWSVCPRRIAKAAAVKAWASAIRRADPSAIIAGARRYAKSVEGKDAQYIAHPATWLNAERWTDEPEPKGRVVSIEDHAAAWGMRNANHDGDSGRTSDNRRQEPSRRPEDGLPGMQPQPQASEPEAAVSVGHVQGGWDCGALPSLRLVGGEAF